MRIQSPHSEFSILFLLLFCLALLAPSNVAAQVDEKEKAQKELERRQELERKTLGLLDEIVAAAWSLKLPENRSFVMASAAELLWPRDAIVCDGVSGRALVAARRKARSKSVLGGVQ